MPLPILALANVAATLIPSVAKLFTGPEKDEAIDRVAAAVQVITGTDNPEEAAKILAMDESKRQELQQHALEISVELNRLANEDRANARNREIQTGDVWTPRILAFAWSLAACGAGWAMLGWADITPAQKELANLIIGFLGAKVGTILDYYFGSSAKK